LKAEAKFCNACGTSTGTTTTNPSNEKERSVVDEKDSTTKPKKGKTGSLAIIGSAIVIFGGFLLVNYYQKNLSPAANATKTAQNAGFQTEYAQIDQTATAEADKVSATEEAILSVQATEDAISAGIEATRAVNDAKFADTDEIYPVHWTSPDGTQRLYLFLYACYSDGLLLDFWEFHKIGGDALVIDKIWLDYDLGNLDSPNYETFDDMGADPGNDDFQWYAYEYNFPFVKNPDPVQIWITFLDGTTITLETVFTENECGN
jgi:hypothetical protein